MYFFMLIPKMPGWIAWHSSCQMNYLSFQKSPDKSQISYFLLCNYIGLFIPVARLESDRVSKHVQSLQLAGDKSHTILPGKNVICFLRSAGQCQWSHAR